MTPILASVVERLTEDRLLTAHEGTVEVAHEALLREWPRFQEWLTEDAQGRELREHLTQSAKRWESTGRDAAELYRGARLSATLDWAAGRQQELNELEREFLAESRAESERELARQRRTNRRLRGLLAGVGVLLVARRGRRRARPRRTRKREGVGDGRDGSAARRRGAARGRHRSLPPPGAPRRRARRVGRDARELEAALVRAPEAIRFERPLPGRSVRAGRRLR